MNTEASFTLPEPTTAFGTYSPTVIELEGPFQHGFVHARGARFHIVQAGATTDPLLLLLHGAYSGWFEYRYLIAPLAAAGFHVSAIDMRGFGMSDKPPLSYGYNMRAATSDIAGLIQALGHDQAILVGSDTGGSIAWCTAAAYPQQVSQLIVSAAAHPADLRILLTTTPWLAPHLLKRTTLTRASGQLRISPATFKRNLENSTNAVFHTSPRWEEELALRILAAGISATKTGTGAIHRLLNAPGTTRWSSPIIEQPTLLIHPDKPLWQQLGALSKERAPQLEIAQIPQVGELPAVENPAAFKAQIISFAQHR
ncbi:alpha/beta fold hydrolase [Corynebacterium caspium]|uniref:alpha/beta fold hydrolase n=1 Tax=Corynebacterium caspium TaxID=234828 RepID=UPI0003607D21|nr:alpha/beta hydrolase [Corynebacterium caspium]WKD58569.1 Soluble epoxide hydrolase [Corynebacterium caspium DSM 44850]